MNVSAIQAPTQSIHSRRHLNRISVYVRRLYSKYIQEAQ